MATLTIMVVVALTAMSTVTCQPTSSSTDSLKSIEAALKTLMQSVNQINDKLKQQEAKTNDQQKSIDSILSTVNDLSSVRDSVLNNTRKMQTEKLTIETIGKQLIQQQLFVEERIRSEGQSGIKVTRHTKEGTRNYFGEHYISDGALAAHDHADYDRTIGLGEFAAVMNGVEFRTRHNDYKFIMPANKDKQYDEVVGIKFPPVPPEVTSKGTLDGKIVEMRKWFKAFKDQDYSVRDYRKYFKANLCYLEGGWTLGTDTLQEPFQSDRHQIDASSWFELQEKIRFTSYGGTKNHLENYAYLPTTMYNFTDGVPQMAQWNYRILCHPLKEDLPTDYLAVHDDLATRLARNIPWNKIKYMRQARFRINEFGTERSYVHSLLDRLMFEIPGKDGYGCQMTDSTFGSMYFDVSNRTGNSLLNACMYHRWYKLTRKGAMGSQVTHRGFHDENLWVAKTTRPKVMPLTTNRKHKGKYEYETSRLTYAIPLEIIYTTPLQGWNPLNIEYHSDLIVTNNRRYGGLTKDKAYNGSSYKHFYRTPVEFYKDGKIARDGADTARIHSGVLDRDGNVRKAAPTGFRVMTPEIQDVGVVRMRYPIFPVHSEGSPLGQELSALKEIVMNIPYYSGMFEKNPFAKSTGKAKPNVVLKIWNSYKNPPGIHGHQIVLTYEEHETLLNGTRLPFLTSSSVGHRHYVTVVYSSYSKSYYYSKCDGSRLCWDGHRSKMTRLY